MATKPNSGYHSRIDEFTDEIVKLITECCVESASDGFDRGVEMTHEAYSAGRMQPIMHTHEELNAYGRSRELAGRIDERNEVALDNYRGHTFWESTNYKGKFEKFMQNNERRIEALIKKEMSGE